MFEIKLIPVCTLSPVCSSDIITFSPFSILTLAMEGKQPFFFSENRSKLPANVHLA